MTQRSAVRGRLLTFIADPAEAGAAASHRYWADGVVAIEDGAIAAVGEAAEVLSTLPAGTPVDHYPDQLVLPGLIDTHIHFPQTQVIGSYGEQLLEWLQKYTFVEEQKFADPAHSARVAKFFLDELFRNGTTTAVVYCTVRPESAEAFFTESHRRNARMIAGKVMMDRGAPEGLLDTAQRGHDETKALIGRWHGQGRQHYAITPRFALTSSEAQLEAAGALVREHPSCYLQTHLAENKDEIATARRLYPQAASYTDIYDRYGLLGPRSLFGHCVHLDEAELERLSATRSIAAFCPTSNLFIGSGLFDLALLRDPRRPVRVSLATDVGGGTSYSMLRTAAEAYKVLQLRRQNLPALDAFYLMTLGNARALSLEDRIGRLAPGHDADLVVLDARATPAMAHRMETVAGDLAEELFVLMTLGDDRSVRATYVAGAKAHTA
ncbi:MAG: guanine deaminase [Geminicoccaceae bacterium]